MRAWLDWQAGADERRKAQAAGFGAMLSAAPERDSLGLEATMAWNWCGGYEPALLIAFSALNGISDFDAVIMLMGVIRDHGRR